MENPNYKLSNFDIIEEIHDTTGLSHWRQYRKQFPEERRKFTNGQLLTILEGMKQ